MATHNQPSTPEMKAQILKELNAALKELKNADKATLDRPDLIIKVPGACTFEIPYKEGIMEAFKQKISKKWPTGKFTGLPSPKMPSIRATGKRIGGDEAIYFNPYTAVANRKKIIGNLEGYGKQYIETESWIGDNSFLVLKTIVGDKKLGTKGLEHGTGHSDQRVEDIVNNVSGTETKVTAKAIVNCGIHSTKPVVICISEKELGIYMADTFDWIQNQADPDAKLSIKEGLAIWRAPKTGELLAIFAGCILQDNAFFYIINNSRFEEVLGSPANKLHHGKNERS